MIKNVLAQSLLLLSILCTLQLQAQVKLAPHPWIFYNRSQVPELQLRLTTDAAFKSEYDQLSSGSALRYFIKDDATPPQKIKQGPYKNLLAARDGMDRGTMAPLQWGRRMQEWVIPLETVIDDDRYFSNQERSDLHDSCNKIAEKFLSKDYIEHGDNNRSLDEIVGLAFVGVFLFPEDPQASSRYTKVYSRLVGMLESTVKFDTTWPESPRYMNVAIRGLSLFAMAQVNYERLRMKADPRFKGYPLIINDRRYHALFKNFALLASAPDLLEYGHIESPAMGDAQWTKNDLNVLCMGAFQLKTINPEVSKFLYITWEKAGRPDFYVDVTTPYIDYSNHQDPNFVVPSIIHRASGFFVSRNNYNKPNESYLIVRASRDNFHHVHNDAGAFSIFSRRMPLMVHSGVSEYGTPPQKWYISTQSHNLVVFKNDKGEPVDGMQNGVNIFKDHILSPEMDFVKLRITPPNGLANKYYRTIAVLKDPQEIYIVYDYIESTHPSTNNLHYLTNQPIRSEVNGIQRAIASNKKGMTMQTDFLLPEANVSYDPITTGPIDRVPRSWGRTQQWIKVNGDAGESYLTVLTPRATNEKDIVINKFAQDNSKCKAFTITGAEGTKYMVIANLSDVSQQVSIQTSLQLRNLFNKNIYKAGTVPGTALVPVAASSVSVFKMETVAISLPVEFISFDAAAKNEQVDLSWTVVPDINNDHFTVQRSANGIDHWTDLASLPPQTVQASTQTYRYTDLQPLSGKAYYRIMQTDANGVSIYSVTKTATINKGNTVVKVLGNPVNGTLHLRLPADNQPYLVQVVDAAGKVVRQQQFAANAGLVSIDLQTAPNGIYFVRATGRDNTQTEEIVVAH